MTSSQSHRGSTTVKQSMIPSPGTLLLSSSYSFDLPLSAAESAMSRISDVVNKIMQISGEMNIYGRFKSSYNIASLILMSY